MSQSIHAIIQESSDWLVGEQDVCGGWGERKGSKPNSLNTAEAILALLKTEPPPSDSIAQGVAYLLRHQVKDKENAGACWMREIQHDHDIVEVPDIIRTCFAIQALSRACNAPAERELVKQGVQWLLGRQLPDGGWGFSRGSSGSYMPTCLALFTLITACGKRACEHGEQIRKGFASLRANFLNMDGSFGRHPELVVTHTIHAVLLLKAALNCQELGTFLNPHDLAALLDKAKNWLLANATTMKQVNEETFRIDPDKGIGNYRFKYMTDALLVQAFEDTKDLGKVSKVVTDTLDKRKAPGGGFYGDRVSTWATAKVLSGLQIVKALPSEVRKRKQNEGITFAALGVIVIMILGTIYLAAVDRLSAELFSLFVLFVSGDMLLANKITGGEFMAILKKLLHLPEPKAV